MDKLEGRINVGRKGRKKERKGVEAKIGKWIRKRVESTLEGKEGRRKGKEWTEREGKGYERG